ncbi:MAG: GTPase HflX [Chloroflexi bacterium]|nr:GTPase HflX [Chloroflexota bacterium]
MIETTSPRERAYLVALDMPRQRFDPDDSLSELAALVAAAGGEVVGRAVQRRSSPDPRTWIGKGKVGEVAAAAKELRADLIVTDDELAPSQQRNLERDLGIRVVDRSGVILDIFARHARTREGRLQVEVAQLEYMRPRLRGMWTHLERLGGGVGTRGPGESQLESDRRVLDKRLGDLKERLRAVEGQRERSRRSRSHDGLFLASLVGYTNAGKSTLMNALSGAGVLVADQPFATLDPTTRRAALPNGTVVLLSDTVGFVNKLPPTLVAAFRATLEELAGADLLVRVVDASHPNLHEHMAVASQTLRELGHGERPTLVVMNKADMLRGPEGDALREALGAEFPGAVFVSARRGTGLDALRERLAAAATEGWERVSVRLPYSAGGLLQRIREHGNLMRADYGEAGIDVEAEVPPAFAAELTRTGAGARAR